MVCGTSLTQHLADGRVSANLLTFYGLIVLAVLAGLVIRSLLAHGRNRLQRLLSAVRRPGQADCVQDRTPGAARFPRPGACAKRAGSIAVKGA